MRQRKTGAMLQSLILTVFGGLLAILGTSRVTFCRRARRAVPVLSHMGAKIVFDFTKTAGKRIRNFTLPLAMLATQ
jgi:hypothetical protein